MSHSENYTDTGRTSVFYDGMQYGVEKERERIVELLENGSKTHGPLYFFDQAITEASFDLPDGNSVVELNSVYLAMEAHQAWLRSEIKGEQKPIHTHDIDVFGSPCDCGTRHEYCGECDWVEPCEPEGEQK